MMTINDVFVHLIRFPLEEIYPPEQNNHGAIWGPSCCFCLRRVPENLALGLS